MNPEPAIRAGNPGALHGPRHGIIDTLHLVEVARAAGQLDLKPADLAGVKSWFAAYIDWMTTHPYGITERDAKNNHGTCWVHPGGRVRATHRQREQMAWCRNRYKTVLIPHQEAPDGSFP